MTTEKPDWVTVINHLCRDLHTESVDAGWWHDQETGDDLRESTYVLGTKLALMHSEGLRRGRKDDHLPHYDAEAVELADVLIRIFDYAGARGYPLGDITAEKMQYNRVRADHKLKNRQKQSGKKF